MGGVSISPHQTLPQLSLLDPPLHPPQHSSQIYIRIYHRYVRTCVRTFSGGATPRPTRSFDPVNGLVETVRPWLRPWYAKTPHVSASSIVVRLPSAIFSERERSRSLFAVARPSVCRLSCALRRRLKFSAIFLRQAIH